MMKDGEQILIVDDEEAIRFFLKEELIQAGYAVVGAGSGERALRVLEREPVDLVILDLNLSGIDGLRVLEHVECLPSPPVVVILTAHGSLDSAVKAMRMGGFDYLTKPCDIEALLATIERGLTKRRQLLRQQRILEMIRQTAEQLQLQAQETPEFPLSSSQPRYLEGRGLLLDRERALALQNGKELKLTPTEFKLLTRLMAEADQAVSYRELLVAVHGDEVAAEDPRDARRALGTHLWRLRQKLGQAPDGHPYIVNVRGRGYTFVSHR
jgi:DNA-binding response OmpR family regulator